MFVPISLNVNWVNPSNWTRTKQVCCPLSGQIHLSACSSNIGKDPKYVNKSLIGGTAILTYGIWASKVTNYFPDSSGFGTSTVTTIQGKNNKKISFVAAYIAVSKGTNIGIDSLYAQQMTLFERDCIKCGIRPSAKHCPQMEAIIRLDSIIHSLQQQHHAIILMLDANQASKECYAITMCALSLSNGIGIAKEWKIHLYN
jgi:hypothetical protein